MIPYEILQKVAKPTRYTGGEFNSVAKDWAAVECRMILYGIMNRRKDALCERVYSPWAFN